MVGGPFVHGAGRDDKQLLRAGERGGEVFGFREIGPAHGDAAVRQILDLVDVAAGGHDLRRRNPPAQQRLDNLAAEAAGGTGDHDRHDFSPSCSFGCPK